ncbi:MAG: hypothetical protein HRU75_12190 [Planctomycetia bacterium]|nr:MAG: hypothetical protein HRU75_12190 [Planctomycetia bacterium]
MSRNVALGVFALLALGVAAFLVFGRRGSSGADFATRVMINGACLACKKDVSAEFKSLDIAPYPCPHCRQSAVFPKFFCVSCKRVFVPVPDRSSGTPRIPQSPRCTACKSTYTQGYYPGLEIQQPKGEAPLPPWP